MGIGGGGREAIKRRKRKELFRSSRRFRGIICRRIVVARRRGGTRAVPRQKKATATATGRAQRRRRQRRRRSRRRIRPRPIQPVPVPKMMAPTLAMHLFGWRRRSAAHGCARLRTAALRHERAARRHREVGWFVARHSSCVLVPWMIIVMRKHTHRFVIVKCALLRDDQIAI